MGRLGGHGTNRLSWRGPLLAGTLGVAALSGAPPVFAQAGQAQSANRDVRGEVVISADRLSDEAITARVSQALHDNPYIFSDHVTVATDHGIVRLAGRISDLADLFGILRLARRIAGKGRVLNEIEFAPSDQDSD
jgi:osmotically-inducible protein OsmY